MSAGLRRTLAFVAMVAAGLALALVFAEESVAPRPSARDRALGDDPQAVDLVDRSTRTEMRVTVGELDFDVTREVEVAPGRTETRVVYRVHILGGQPGPEGQFLVDHPRLTLLDPLTGAERGWLTAERGRFRTDQAVGGKLRFDLGRIRAESFALAGSVHGELLQEEGAPVTLDTEELQLEGARLDAPGKVTASRGDLLVQGEGLVWERLAARLSFARDARVRLAGTPDQPQGMSVLGAGGLTWNLPGPGEVGRGWGELRGPVTGEADGGERLGGEHLLFQREGQALLLSGAAWLEFPRAGRTWRLSAATIRAAREEDGTLRLAEADGDAVVEALDALGPPVRLEAASLRGGAGVLAAPGDVRWRHGALSLRGFDLVWDEGAGRVELSRDVVVEGLAGTGPPWEGSRLQAPAGLEWILPVPEVHAGLLLLRGPVAGHLGDGSQLACAELRGIGAPETLILLGDAHLERPDELGQLAVSGQRIELAFDEAGRLAAASAQGRALLRRTPREGPALTVATETVEVSEGLVVAPDVVEVAQGGFLLTGQALRYDDRQGQLDLQSDVRLQWLRPGEELPLLLHAPGGLSAWLPEDRRGGFEQGRGELRGPITGSMPGGRTVRAERVLLDGAARHATLLQDAELAVADVGLLRSSRLDLHLDAGGFVVSSPAQVEWSSARLEGGGVGLRWDEAAGTLRVEREVALQLRDAAGAPQLEVEAEGPLSWATPVGARDPLAEGSGELLGDVRGTRPDGGSFRTPRLRLDGPSGLLAFEGLSRIQQPQDAGLAELAAAGAIEMLQGADGPALVRAFGGVTGAQTGRGVLLAADELVADRSEGTTILSGTASLSRGPVRLRTGARGAITAREDPPGTLHSVVASGEVTISAPQVDASGDRLAWDVDADHVVLSGNCLLRAEGLSVTAPSVEVWPEAGRWYIPSSTIVVDGQPY